MSLNLSLGSIIDLGDVHLKTHDIYVPGKKKIFVLLDTSESYLTPNIDMGGIC